METSLRAAMGDGHHGGIWAACQREMGNAAQGSDAEDQSRLASLTSRFTIFQADSTGITVSLAV